MKPVILFFVLCVLVYSSIAQTPVAHYPFNGNANDAVGSNNGTVNGALLSSDRFNSSSSAYTFNGSSNNITIPDAPAFNFTSTITLSAWIFPTAYNTTWPTIVAKYNSTNSFELDIKNDNTIEWSCFIGGAQRVLNGGSIALNQWYHIAAVYDGAQMKIYQNGILVAAQAVTGNIGANSFPVEIGTRSGGGAPFTGKIDEVKIYATALTPAQILAEYNSSPVVYYPFNGNANDAMGVLNGTVSGVTLTADRFGNTATAYSFDGVNDYIELGGNSNIIRPTVALTVSLWFKLENTGGTTDGRVLISNTECNTGYEIWWNKQGNMISGLVSRNGTYANVEYPATTYLSGWHFVTLTYDGRYSKLYLDGVLKATNDAGGNYPISYCNQAYNYIGTESGNNAPDPAWHWYGQIDEVKIYNNALSAPQIFEDYFNSKKVNKPGSGNAISFNGNNHIQVPDADGINDFETTQDFTLECWVKIPAGSQPNPGVGGNYIIDKTGIGNANASYNLVMNNQIYPQYNGMVFIQRYDGINQPGLRCTTRINDDKWHHIAATRTGGNSGILSIYIDGVLEGTIADNTTGSTSNSAPMYIGSRYGNYSRLLGTIDEVRIWNIGLNQTQIRERMCRKISSSDALFANLTAYYNFDESTGTTPIDGTAYANNGTLTSSSVIALSGAPVGNFSAFDYAASPNVTLTHPQGESLQATVTGGAPAGIHVYNVNEAPNTVTGALGSGNNDRYFGVFVAGGTSPQYTATYNYNGNPNVTPTNEPNLLLYKRDDNAATTWTDCGAALNTTANTLTATGQNTEYLLGGGFSTLPITLLNFEVEKTTTTAILKWSTAAEQNNKGFQVLHAADGVNFAQIGFVNGSGNSNFLKQYAFTHNSPVKGKNYYRLRQVDMDNRSSLSRVLYINFEDAGIIYMYPNPVKDILKVQVMDNIAALELYDASGKKLWQQTNKTNRSFLINTSGFANGLLLLKAIDRDGKAASYKIIKN